MFEWMHKIRAEFCRGQFHNYIKVTFRGNSENFILFEGEIMRGSRRLSKEELAVVITILKRKKEAIAQRNFPFVYGGMLSDLCDVQTERYGVREDKKKE